MESPEFAPYFWHDNLIRSLRLEIGDPETDNWRSEIILDIDHIVRWLATTDGRGGFEVAPATVTFHDAADLCIALDCGDTGGQVALTELSIDRITREPVQNQKVHFDKPFYRWRIELNWPRAGLISFAASAYTQILRANPVATTSARIRTALKSSDR